MIFLTKPKFEAKALRLAMILLKKQQPPLFNGCLERAMKMARRELVDAGVVFSLDGGEVFCHCGAARKCRWHGGIEFKCGTLLSYKEDGTLETTGKCKAAK